ncbi:MAG: hypothetical protein ACRDVD_02290 [Acidimicrobiia bacterium]
MSNRQIVGWSLGAGTLALLAFSLWSLGTDPNSAPPVGVFGAAAGPGTFALPETTTTTIRLTTTSTSVPSTTTTVRATSTASTEPETTTTTLAPLVLAADGLDVVDLGETYEETLAAVSDRLGQATENSGWVGASSSFGVCPGTVVRMARWSSLRLLFSDGPTEFGEDTRHFFYYSQSTVGTDEVLDLTTDEGIGLGSTVAELESSFGDDLTIESTLRFGVGFFVDSPGRGLLSGTLTNSSDSGTVTSLGGGFGCGG